MNFKQSRVPLNMRALRSLPPNTRKGAWLHECFGMAMVILSTILTGYIIGMACGLAQDWWIR